MAPPGSRSRSPACRHGRQASRTDSPAGKPPSRAGGRVCESSVDHRSREALLEELRKVVHRQKPGKHAETTRAMILHFERRGCALLEQRAEEKPCLTSAEANNTLG
eukprot:jgi/Tetstr1/456452/TSEL_004115.t1